MQMYFQLALLLLTATSGLPAQEPATSQDLPQGTFRDTVSVGWVEVPVLVLGKKERHLEDLTLDRFRLSVDGKPVASETFESGEGPIGVLIAVDTSGSMAIGNKLELSRLLVERVARGLGSSDRAALVAFSDRRVEVLAPFRTVSRQADESSGKGEETSRLLDACDRLEAGGLTALRDAVVRFPTLAAESGAWHRAVLVLTDGIDNASLLTQREVQAALSEAAAPLYVVDVGSGMGQRRRSEHGKDLRQVALASGGRYLTAASPGDAVSIAQVFLEETRQRYVLRFSTEPGERTAEHTIEVHVAGPMREMRYRTRYFGGGPARGTAAREPSE